MLTRTDLKRLAAVSGPCLTIFQPVRDNYSQLAKPHIRIASALHEADRLLEEKGFDAMEREEMLRPLHKFASNTDWSSRKGSVVLFRAPDFTMAAFWPEALAPRVRLAEEFLVLPLMPLLLSSRDFWLLGLSINAVNLFRGSPDGIVEMPLPAGVPKSLSEAGGFDQPDHSLRNRSSAGHSIGSMKGVQFSTSSAFEVEINHLHDFFKTIDRGIHAILAEDPHPLILAGVTREVAIYRKVNTYAPLLTGAVHGNPEAIGRDALHAKAAELMIAFSAHETDAKLREIEEATNRGRVVTEPEAVIDAARDGQVEELFVTPGIDRHEDAVNWAALATIRNSGGISILSASRIASGVAAILRFPPLGRVGEPKPRELTQT